MKNTLETVGSSRLDSNAIGYDTSYVMDQPYHSVIFTLPLYNSCGICLSFWLQCCAGANKLINSPILYSILIFSDCSIREY